MNGINHIIFYGTLMNKCGSRGLRHEPHCSFLQDITVKGRLHSVGGFPALVMGNEEVRAELYKINNYDIMPRFDAIEGYSGRLDADMYTRTVVHVPEVNEYAWIYTWNSDPDSLPHIESGDWHQYSRSKN